MQSFDVFFVVRLKQDLRRHATQETVSSLPHSNAYLIMLIYNIQESNYIL